MQTADRGRDRDERRCPTDHRAVDGALGAELLGAFKTLIENPVMMVVLMPFIRIDLRKGKSAAHKKAIG